MIALTSKCYYADNELDSGAKDKKQKISSKGVKKNQNKKTWEDYKKALLEGHKDIAHNVGFRRDKNRVITYDQEKLGLSAYYDKRCVHEDLIHTENLF